MTSRRLISLKGIQLIKDLPIWNRPWLKLSFSLACYKAVLGSLQIWEMLITLLSFQMRQSTWGSLSTVMFYYSWCCCVVGLGEINCRAGVVKCIWAALIPEDDRRWWYPWFHTIVTVSSEWKGPRKPKGHNALFCYPCGTDISVKLDCVSFLKMAIWFNLHWPPVLLFFYFLLGFQCKNMPYLYDDIFPIVIQ